LLPALAVCAQREDIAAKARRAGELTVAGKAEEAIPIYQELARALPGNAEMLVNLSIAEFKARRFRDAAAHAEAALQIRPDSLAANLFLGSSYVELENYRDAIPPLEKVIAVQERDRNARLMLGEALLGLERLSEAVMQFQLAYGLAPENPKVWYGLGRCYDALSERQFLRLQSDFPDSPYWHALAGDTYLRQRRNGKAFVEYRLALAGSASIPGVHAGLALAYRRTGHARWAEIEEERERQMPAPDCGAGGLACDFLASRYQQIARATESARAPEELYWASKAYAALARESYDHLTTLPASLESHLHAAKSFDSSGLYRQASGEWRAALALAPDDERIQTSLAWSLFRAGDYGAAAPVLLVLLNAQHSTPELNFLYGASLMNLEQPGKSIPFLEAAVRLDPGFLPAQAALGQALLRTGKPADAIPHLRAALPGDSDENIHFQLLRAYQLTGQTNLAARALAEYRDARSAAEQRRRLEEGTEISPP
jgi:predicted Zn-dependent protease